MAWVHAAAKARAARAEVIRSLGDFRPDGGVGRDPRPAAVVVLERDQFGRQALDAGREPLGLGRPVGLDGPEIVQRRRRGDQLARAVGDRQWQDRAGGEQAAGRRDRR